MPFTVCDNGLNKIKKLPIIQVPQIQTFCKGDWLYFQSSHLSDCLCSNFLSKAWT